MKNRKILTLLTIMLALLLVATGCSSASSGNPSGNESTSSSKEENAEKITLRFASASPANAPYTVGLMEPFMKRVTELTEGQVEFEFFPAEQLGKAVDLLDLTSNGVADIGYYGSSFYPSKMPIGSTLAPLPGLHESSYQQTMAFHELVQSSPMLETDFLNNGVRPIITNGIIPYEFYTKGEVIKVPADLKGKKVRSTGGAGAAMLEYAGATPVTVNTPDMFESFDQGIIDVIYQFPTTMNSYGLQDLVKYGTLGATFGSSVVGFVINENVYQNLPDNVKEALHQGAEEIMAEYASYADEESAKILQGWIDDLGIEIYELNEEEKQQWKDFAEEFNEQYINAQEGKTEILEVLEKYKENLKKYKQ